jgi:carboxyl-terminal processing protease
MKHLLKKNSTRIFLALLLAIVSTAAQVKDTLFEITKNIEIFTDVYRTLQESYVDEPEPGFLMKKAIDAMLASLDPYTVYYPESRIEEATFMQTGQYGGIGINTKRRDGKILITDVYAGFGADKAGLKIGDIITHIEGKDISKLTDDESGNMIKGQPGTLVKLTVIKGENNETVNVEVKRENIKNKDVPFYGLIPNTQTGYIKLDGFTQTASTEVKEAFLNLKKQNIEGLILDLRGNGGGLLREAVSIVNLFVPKGSPIVETRGRIAEWKNQYGAQVDPIDIEIPLAVLIDEFSASASEIVAGSLQDLDRAVVIGKESFGKGLVQQTVDLAYNTKMKLTVAKYYTPSGRCVQRLDYSHRDPNNGKVSAIDEAAIQTFTTKRGRKVVDGRGIQPDVNVDTDKNNDWLKEMQAQLVLFDFVTQNVPQFSSIDTLGNFNLPESTLQSFSQYLEKINFKPHTENWKKLNEFKEKNNVDSESIDEHIKAIEKIILPDNKKQMQQHHDYLAHLLETEIVRRTKNERAHSRQAIRKDPVVQQALTTLKSDYKKILLYP